MTHAPCTNHDADWPEACGRFVIDTETDIAFGTFAGGLRPGDLLAAMATTVRFRGSRSGLRALADLRDATVLWNDGDELAFRRSLYAQFPTRLPGRCALLAPRCMAGPRDAAQRQAAAGSPGTETLLENLYLRVDARLFRDFGQAMRWLLPPEEAQPNWKEQPDTMDGVPLLRKTCGVASTASHCN